MNLKVSMWSVKARESNTTYLSIGPLGEMDLKFPMINLKIHVDAKFWNHICNVIAVLQ